MKRVCSLLCALALTLCAATGLAQQKAPAKAQKPAAQQPRISREELISPYEGLDEQASTMWQYDSRLGLDLDRAAQQNPFSFHLGRERVVDPVTGREVTPPQEQGKDKSDLKGTIDKAGGKAEVQVDVFKF